MPAFSAEELTQAVHDNLRNLGLDVLDVVNFRNMLGTSEAALGTLKRRSPSWPSYSDRGLCDILD